MTPAERTEVAAALSALVDEDAPDYWPNTERWAEKLAPVIDHIVAASRSDPDRGYAMTRPEDWWDAPVPVYPMRGAVFVHEDPGYVGRDDAMEEALHFWKQGRRRNADLTPFRYGVPS